MQMAFRYISLMPATAVPTMGSDVAVAWNTIAVGALSRKADSEPVA